MKKVFSREHDSKGVLYHAGDRFYILTDKDNVFDFKVVTLSDEDFECGAFDRLEDFYLPREGEIINEIDLFKDNLVLYISKDGHNHMTVIELETKEHYNIEIKEKFALINPGLNENYDTDTFRFHVDTPFVYNRVYEYNLKSKNIKLLEDFEITGPKFDPG